MLRQFDRLTVLSKIKGQAHHPEPTEGSNLPALIVKKINKSVSKPYVK